MFSSRRSTRLGRLVRLSPASLISGLRSQATRKDLLKTDRRRTASGFSMCNERAAGTCNVHVQSHAHRCPGGEESTIIGGLSRAEFYRGRSHKGVSNEVPHTTYRLPNRAPLGGSWFNSSLLPQPRPKAPNSSLPPFLACWPIVAPVHEQWGDPILSSDFFRPSHHRGSAGGNGSKWRRSWLQKRFHPSHLSSNWQHM